jgi:5-methylcytosine-specific restriction protein B
VYTRRFVPILASNPLAATLRPSGIPVPIADGQMMVNDTYLSLEHLRAALEALKQHKGPPVVGWSIPAMLREGVPVTDDPKKAKKYGGKQETAFLDRYFRLGDNAAKPYFNPFTAAFVEPNYASRSLQQRRNDLERSEVLLHPTDSDWAIRTDFATRLLKDELKRKGPVPFWALALWMQRGSDVASVDAAIDAIWTECHMGSTPATATIFDRKAPAPVTALPLEAAQVADADLLRLVRGGTSSGARSLAQIVDAFGDALRASYVDFGTRHTTLVRSFVASLATKRFVILTGLSGSGKTQLALRFGDWLGDGRSLVVPVRPDWTGADALFGYEDALREPDAQGRRSWNVPDVLAFMLKAARDAEHPHLLLLDEMNLAHVERYFADVLSGMESGEPCLPNLAPDAGGIWRADPENPRIPIPSNLFVVGTVNVDETTYMFSPKVLDRANTFEFRVLTDDLSPAVRRPIPIEAASDEEGDSFLRIATDDTWQEGAPAKCASFIAEELKRAHAVLARDGFEFGHRVYYESLRFAAMYEAAGGSDRNEILDAIVVQKILPRLHGARRRLEPVLAGLGAFCASDTKDISASFDPLDAAISAPRMPISFDKIRRMTRSVRLHQFASFTE